jgi:Ala-tRNA(Pro) deacylase
MAISSTLKGFLDGAKVRYTVAKHPVAYTAQEIAAAQHVPGRQLAKCVLVLTDRGPALAVLSAVFLIDLKKLRAALGAKKLSIGRESDIKRHFPDVEVGAMSPFGNLYGVPVIADRGLQAAQEIVFNAGSHTETIKMRYADFAALVKPKTGAFALPLPKSKPVRRAKAPKAAKRRPAPRARRTAARTRRKR